MSSVVISGDTSGAITLSAPAVAGTNTITLPAGTGSVVVSGINSAITAGTAVASTSGTSIDFTSIPSWVKRITVMFNGISTNGTANPLIQIGSGSVTTTGYVSTGGIFNGSSGTASSSSTAGYVIGSGTAAALISGQMVLTLISGNIWVSSHAARTDTSNVVTGGGTGTLSGALDRVRITTTNGTDTFDAGSINILYE